MNRHMMSGQKLGITVENKSVPNIKICLSRKLFSQFKQNSFSNVIMVNFNHLRYKVSYCEGH